MKALLAGLVVLFATCVASAAPHTRLYAVVLANEDPKAFMGGSSLGSGLYVSDDTAKSWRHLGWTHLKAYSVDVIGDTIYLATGEGILVSTNAGERFTIAEGSDRAIPHAFEVMDIAHDPKNPSQMYAATTRGMLMKANDGSWGMMPGGEQLGFCSRVLFNRRRGGTAVAATTTGVFWSSSPTDGWHRSIGTSQDITSIAQPPINYKWYALTRAGQILVSIDSARSFFATTGNGDTTVAPQPENVDSAWSIFPIVRRCMVGGRLATLERGDFPDHVTNAPANVNSLCNIGATYFLASLGQGVFRNVRGNDTLTMIPTGLDRMQVWTIKAIEVKE